jgi:hypothetical protein
VFFSPRLCLFMQIEFLGFEKKVDRGLVLTPSKRPRLAEPRLCVNVSRDRTW